MALDASEFEIISRDRGNVYIEGATLGAPHAQQVADRWHLLRNLREALEQLLDRHRSALQVVREVATHTPASAVSPTRMNKAERLRRRARSYARYEGLQRCMRVASPALRLPAGSASLSARSAAI